MPVGQRSATRTGMILDPRGEELAREPAHAHSRHMSGPAELAIRDEPQNARHVEAGVKRPVAAGIIPDIPARDTAHGPHASVVERFELVLQRSGQQPALTSIEQNLQHKAVIESAFGAERQGPVAKVHPEDGSRDSSGKYSVRINLAATILHGPMISPLEIIGPLPQRRGGRSGRGGRTRSPVVSRLYCTVLKCAIGNGPMISNGEWLWQWTNDFQWSGGHRPVPHRSGCLNTSRAVQLEGPPVTTVQCMLPPPSCPAYHHQQRVRLRRRETVPFPRAGAGGSSFSYPTHYP